MKYIILVALAISAISGAFLEDVAKEEWTSYKVIFEHWIYITSFVIIALFFLMIWSPVFKSQRRLKKIHLFTLDYEWS